MLKVLFAFLGMLFIYLPASFAKSDEKIRLGQNWHFQTTPETVHFQFLMENAEVTRIEQKDLKGVLVFSEFQKINNEQAKKLVMASRQPASSLKVFGPKDSQIFSFKVNNSVYFYSSLGGRIVGSFESLTPSQFVLLGQQIGVKK